MLTTKKQGLRLAIFAAIATGILWTSGCTPPGPRALLQGEKLIQQREFPKAIDRLKVATKLLPNNAQAWNHLGVAYQGNNQPEQARQAYLRAMGLDRQLPAPYYNLGTLYLAYNNPNAAVDGFRTFVALQPNNTQAWLKLAEAQERAGLLADAENSYEKAAALAPDQPEIRNALGIVQAKQKRYLEAARSFHSALLEHTNYAPALLNLAILCQQGFKNPKLALEKYEQYLALKPRPARWDEVSQLAHKLNQQLNSAPPPKQPTPTEVARVKKKPQLSVVSSNPPVAQEHVTAPAHPGKEATPGGAEASQTSELEASHKPSEPTSNAPPAKASPKQPPAVAQKSEPPPSTAEEEPETTAPPPARETEPPLEVVQLPEESAAPGGTETEAVPAGTNTPPAATRANQEPLLVLKPRSKPRTSSARNQNQEPAKTEPTNAPRVQPAPPTPANLPRYAYRSPAVPAAGNRAAAEPLVARGIQEYQNGERSAAQADFQRAVQADPSYFEAQFWLGLTAFQADQLQPAMTSLETALAIRPDSLIARYNFALALKKAHYPVDAANELERILHDHPDEARAHLTLANLYAQELGRREAARQHYFKVLELDPRNPQAGKIRFWLASNP